MCTCQCWLPDANNPEKEKLVVGTDIGEIMYFEGGEVRLVKPWERAKPLFSYRVQNGLDVIR